MELRSHLHASTDENIFSARFLADCASIKANYLAVVAHLFTGATVEIFQSAGQGHMAVRHWLREDLVEAAESSTEVAAFNLSALCVNNLTEWVLLEEELFKYLVAVLLVNVAATTDGIRADDARVENFFAVLLVDSPQLFCTM